MNEGRRSVGPSSPRARREPLPLGCGDGGDFRAALTETELLRFRYLLCHRICAAAPRRVCEVVCTGGPVLLVDALTEVRAAGKVVAGVLADEKAFAAIAGAARFLDCETARTAIEQAGFASRCEIVCEFFCTWRCVWVCLDLCGRPTPILTGIHAVAEARNFALACRQLAGQPRALAGLVQAFRTAAPARPAGASVDTIVEHIPAGPATGPSAAVTLHFLGATPTRVLGPVTGRRHDCPDGQADIIL